MQVEPKLDAVVYPAIVTLAPIRSSDLTTDVVFTFLAQRREELPVVTLDTDGRIVVGLTQRKHLGNAGVGPLDGDVKEGYRILSAYRETIRNLASQD